MLMVQTVVMAILKSMGDACRNALQPNTSTPNDLWWGNASRKWKNTFQRVGRPLVLSFSRGISSPLRYLGSPSSDYWTHLSAVSSLRLSSTHQPLIISSACSISSGSTITHCQTVVSPTWSKPNLLLGQASSPCASHFCGFHLFYCMIIKVYFSEFTICNYKLVIDCKLQYIFFTVAL